MATEKPHEPKKPEGPEPFIAKEDRPDLTIDLNKKVGELTVRDLKTLLGGGSSPSKLKEVLVEKLDLSDKIPTKDTKDSKDNKDHKEPKDTKDGKDTKDHKEPKDSKDSKDTKDSKDPKDQKEPKDTKDSKDPKEHKDVTDNKAHKDPKESKDVKDNIDRKGDIIDKVHKDSAEKLPEVVRGVSSGTGSGESSSGNPPAPTGLEGLIERLTGLEKEVRQLKGSGGGAGGPAK